MSKLRKQVWIAVVIGAAISVALSALLYTINGYALYVLQFIGFFVCLMLFGFDSPATKTDYALIAIPVNAGVYAAVIFILLRVIWRSKSVDLNGGDGR
jgi:hypothetical protein